MTRKRKLVITAAGALAVLAFVFLLLPVLPEGTYRYRAYFDLCSGRMCITRSVFGLTICDKIGETDLSAMYRRLVGQPPPPVWRFWYGHGISYRECGSDIAANAKMFAQVINDDTFTDAARKKMIASFFDLARRAEMEKIAWFTWAVCDLLCQAAPGRTLDIVDAPGVPDKAPWPPVR